LAWKLSWHDGSRGLVDSPPYDEAPWRGGFFRWADDTLDPDAAEAAIVLRRACEIAMGRGMDLEAVDSAAELGPMMGAVCYTMQPSVMPVASATAAASATSPVIPRRSSTISSRGPGCATHSSSPAPTARPTP